MAVVNQWDKFGQATYNNRRVKMLVHFEQTSDGQEITTKLEVTVTRLQRRIVFFWYTTSALSITMTGAFSGPRSPVSHYGASPGSGYVQNGNPFTKSDVVFNEKVTHFIDVSPISAPLYAIDNARYSVTALFGGSHQTVGFGPTASVYW